jgi:hypothetical protein
VRSAAERAAATAARAAHSVASGAAQTTQAAGSAVAGALHAAEGAAAAAGQAVKRKVRHVAGIAHNAGAQVAGTVERAASSTAHAVRGSATHVEQAAGDVARMVAGTAEHAASAARGAAEATAHAAKGAAAHAKENVADMAADLTEGTKQAAQRAARAAEQAVHGGEATPAAFSHDQVQAALQPLRMLLERMAAHEARGNASRGRGRHVNTAALAMWRQEVARLMHASIDVLSASADLLSATAGEPAAATPLEQAPCTATDVVTQKAQRGVDTLKVAAEAAGKGGAGARSAVAGAAHAVVAAARGAGDVLASGAEELGDRVGASAAAATVVRDAAGRVAIAAAERLHAVQAAPGAAIAAAAAFERALQERAVRAIEEAGARASGFWWWGRHILSEPLRGGPPTEWWRGPHDACVLPPAAWSLDDPMSFARELHRRETMPNSQLPGDGPHACWQQPATPEAPCMEVMSEAAEAAAEALRRAAAEVAGRVEATGAGLASSAKQGAEALHRGAAEAAGGAEGLVGGVRVAAKAASGLTQKARAVSMRAAQQAAAHAVGAVQSLEERTAAPAEAATRAAGGPQGALAGMAQRPRLVRPIAAGVPEEEAPMDAGQAFRAFLNITSAGLARAGRTLSASASAPLGHLPSFHMPSVPKGRASSGSRSAADVGGALPLFAPLSRPPAVQIWRPAAEAVGAAAGFISGGVRQAAEGAERGAQQSAHALAAAAAGLGDAAARLRGQISSHIPAATGRHREHADVVPPRVPAALAPAGAEAPGGHVAVPGWGAGSHQEAVQKLEAAEQLIHRVWELMSGEGPSGGGGSSGAAGERRQSAGVDVGPSLGLP